MRARVRFVLGVGGYHDIRASIRFFTTGYFEDGGAPLYLKPDDYAKLVFAMSLLTNTDPQETARLLAALPQPIVATIDALTLDNKGLQRLTARLLLVHGRNDRLIPYPESLALGNAVAPGQARVFILNRILGHVDLTLSHFFSLRFWRDEQRG